MFEVRIIARKRTKAEPGEREMKLEITKNTIQDDNPTRNTSDTSEVRNVSRRNVMATLAGAMGAGALAASCEGGEWSNAPELTGHLRLSLGNRTNIAWLDAVANLGKLSSTDYSVVIVAGYSTPGDGGGGIFFGECYTDGTIPDPNLGTIIHGDLCVSGDRTVWFRLYSGTINVRWFGADPYNNNNRTNIQNAIDVAALTGDSLYIPKGVYDVTNDNGTALDVSYGGFTIFGDGANSVLKVSELTERILWIHNSDGIENINIHNLSFDGSRFEIPKPNQACLRFDRCNSVSCRSLIFRNTQTAISCKYVSGFTLDDIFVESAHGYAIAPTDSDHVNASNITVLGTDDLRPRSGFEFKMCRCSSLVNARFERMEEYGVNVRGGYFKTNDPRRSIVSNSHDIVLENITVIDTVKHGVIIHLDGFDAEYPLENPEGLERSSLERISVINAIVHDTGTDSISYVGGDDRGNGVVINGEDDEHIVRDVSLSNIICDTCKAGMQVIRVSGITLNGILATNCRGTGLTIQGSRDFSGTGIGLIDCVSKIELQEHARFLKIEDAGVPVENIIVKSLNVVKNHTVNVEWTNPVPAGSNVYVQAIVSGFSIDGLDTIQEPPA